MLQEWSICCSPDIIIFLEETSSWSVNSIQWKKVYSWLELRRHQLKWMSKNVSLILIALARDMNSYFSSIINQSNEIEDHCLHLVVGHKVSRRIMLENFLTYSIQLIFLTKRLVPRNVVMITIDICKMNLYDQGVDIWN